MAEIGGDAAVAFAEGCSFSIRESETRDWAVVWRAASLVGAKRDLGGAKKKCERLFLSSQVVQLDNPRPQGLMSPTLQT